MLIRQSDHHILLLTDTVRYEFFERKDFTLWKWANR